MAQAIPPLSGSESRVRGSGEAIDELSCLDRRLPAVHGRGDKSNHHFVDIGVGLPKNLAKLEGGGTDLLLARFDARLFRGSDVAR